MRNGSLFNHSFIIDQTCWVFVSVLEGWSRELEGWLKKLRAFRILSKLPKTSSLFYLTFSSRCAQSFLWWFLWPKMSQSYSWELEGLSTEFKNFWDSLRTFKDFVECYWFVLLLEVYLTFAEMVFFWLQFSEDWFWKLEALSRKMEGSWDSTRTSVS